jgi:hypothetical protein
MSSEPGVCEWLKGELTRNALHMLSTYQTRYGRPFKYAQAVARYKTGPPDESINTLIDALYTIRTPLVDKMTTLLKTDCTWFYHDTACDVRNVGTQGAHSDVDIAFTYMTSQKPLAIVAGINSCLNEAVPGQSLASLFDINFYASELYEVCKHRDKHNLGFYKAVECDNEGILNLINPLEDQALIHNQVAWSLARVFLVNGVLANQFAELLGISPIKWKTITNIIKNVADIKQSGDQHRYWGLVYDVTTKRETTMLEYADYKTQYMQAATTKRDYYHYSSYLCMLEDDGYISMGGLFHVVGVLQQLATKNIIVKLPQHMLLCSVLDNLGFFLSHSNESSLDSKDIKYLYRCMDALKRCALAFFSPYYNTKIMEMSNLIDGVKAASNASDLAQKKSYLIKIFAISEFTSVERSGLSIEDFEKQTSVRTTVPNFVYKAISKFNIKCPPLLKGGKRQKRKTHKFTHHCCTTDA